jgi:hypothetical protein
MSSPHSIEITTSKTKLIRLMLASVVFVALGAWFIISPATFKTSRFSGTLGLFLIRAVGIAAVVFFGACLLFMIKKWGDKKPGLIIDEEGITDHSSAIPAGFIPWSDITNIVEISIYKNRLLLIKVKDPSIYINRQTGFLKRKAVEYNYKNYGTPIAIGAQSLQYSFDELKSLLQKKLAASTNPNMA